MKKKFNKNKRYLQKEPVPSAYNSSPFLILLLCKTSFYRGWKTYKWDVIERKVRQNTNRIRTILQWEVYCGIFATFSFSLETRITFSNIFQNFLKNRKHFWRGKIIITFENFRMVHQKFLTKYILNFSLFRHINKSEHRHQHELVLLTMNVQNSSVGWKCKRALFITNCVTVCILVSLTSFGKCHGLVWPCVPFGWNMSWNCGSCRV